MRISDWSSDVCSSDLVSVTVICTLSPASRAWTTISAPSSLGVTAYLIAFSTKGCSSSDGSRAFSTLGRSEEHTSELQSLMRISYAVFCLKKKKTQKKPYMTTNRTTPQNEVDPNQNKTNKLRYRTHL